MQKPTIQPSTPSESREIRALPPADQLMLWLRRYAQRRPDSPATASWLYPNPAAFVLAEGKPFTPARLTRHEDQAACSIAAAYHRNFGGFEHQESFVNSQRCLLLDRNRRFTYVEGFVFDAMLGFADSHAWLALDGKIIDFTGMAFGNARLKTEPLRILGESALRSYFGVEFRREYVEQRAGETGRLHALIDDWEHHFPLLAAAVSGWRA